MAWEIMGVWASRRFLSWVVGEDAPPQGDQPVTPTGEGTEEKAMEGPGLLNRKTTTPAPTPMVRLSGCSRPAAILLYPHTCLRRRAKFEGVSVWGLSVRQQRSTELGNGVTTRCRGVPKGILRWEWWLESHKGTMAEEGTMALEGMIALMGTMARGGAMALGGIIAPRGTMAPGSSVKLSSRAWPEEATPKRPDEGTVYRQRPFERVCRKKSMDLPSPGRGYPRDTMEE